MADDNVPLLEIEGVRVVFTRRGNLFGEGQQVIAVDDVSLGVDRGEILGLVGSSGSGKSTLARSILRLIEPQAGKISFDGADVLAMKRQQLRQFRRRAQIIFQDPGAALRPGWTIGKILAEPLLLHGLVHRSELRPAIEELLDMVELPATIMDRYAFELSGGQRQRASIARALGLRPSFLVADEALSALDLSVQAALLGLFHNLRERLGLSILMISHDIDVLACVANRLAVMDHGRIVEQGNVETILTRPKHPATRALIAATS